MITHAIGLLVSPRKNWQALGDVQDGKLSRSIVYILVMALIPAIAWYYGTTQVGWEFSGGDITRLTEESALPMIILFYVAMVSTVLVIGGFIHWMSSTYGADSNLTKATMISGASATPMFVIGAVGFYPLFWLDLLAGMFSVGWAVYLLYIGIPVVMKIPEERGFLFASAVLAVAMVMLIIIMGSSVILWDMGAAPQFVS
jgi:hypothetical protein